MMSDVTYNFNIIYNRSEHMWRIKYTIHFYFCFGTLYLVMKYIIY